MPICNNCPPGGRKKYYEGTEPSPKGLGCCGGCAPEGAITRGKDGKLWVNKMIRGRYTAWKPYKGSRRQGTHKCTSRGLLPIKYVKARPPQPTRKIARKRRPIKQSRRRQQPVPVSPSFPAPPILPDQVRQLLAAKA